MPLECYGATFIRFRNKELKDNSEKIDKYTK
jgi:hypothetical protein